MVKGVCKNGIGIDTFRIGIYKFDEELELTKWN